MGLSKSMLRSRRQAALRVMTQACRQSKSAKSMLAIASSLFKVRVAERLLQRRLAEFVGRLLQDLIDIARAEVSTKHMRLRLKCNDQIRGGAPLLLPVQSALTVTLPPDFTHHHDHEAFVPTEQVCKRVDVSRVCRDLTAYTQAGLHRSLPRPRRSHFLEREAEENHDAFQVWPVAHLPVQGGEAWRPSQRLTHDGVQHHGQPVRLPCAVPGVASQRHDGCPPRLLASDPEARRRKLRLRTYAVVCLNEECGLMEWVENTSGFRQVVRLLDVCPLGARPVSVLAGADLAGVAQVSSVYRMSNVDAPIVITKRHRTEFETLQTRYAGNPDSRVYVYRKKILKHFPALFHKWFLSAFADPTQWFESR